MPGTTNFPTALDAANEVDANTPENEAGKEHDVLHNNLDARTLAIEAKVGIDGSADTDSLDYKVAALQSGKIASSEKGAASGVASLDGSGKVPTSQLPALSITSVFVVASQAAQLALTVQEGDVAVRTDQSKSWIHNGGTAGTMADWTEMLAPTAAVASVAGKTGTVTLEAADITSGVFAAARMATGSPATGYVPTYQADGSVAWQAQIGGQAAIQFKDEGSNAGTAGGITAVDFVGAGVSAAAAGGTLTVTISGGGGGGAAIDAGTYASLPGSPAEDDVYLVTDAPAVMRYNGSAWDTYGPVWKFTPVVSGSFSWVNQGSATDAARGPYRTLYNAANSMALRVKSAPSTPYTLTVAMLVDLPPGGGSQFYGAGIGWRSSSDGKITLLRVADLSGNSSNTTLARILALTNYSGPSSVNANYFFFPNVDTLVWLRISDDGTNRKAWISRDGFTWTEVYSVSRTDYHTPDQICYAAGNGTNGYGVGATLLHWLEQ
jgi:hypothetical protein